MTVGKGYAPLGKSKVISSPAANKINNPVATSKEKKVTSQFDHDPIAKLRARELDIRAMDNEAKRSEAEKRLNLENMKALMNQDIQETKIDQNEELAELRADTSIEKQEMANANRLKLAGMKPKTNGRSN